MRKRTVVVEDYDPAWPRDFELLRQRIWPVLGDFALGIEHVGSTSVPGLAAKPIIDMTIVVASRDEVPMAIERLASLGYVHKGNLGIDDREAFDSYVFGKTAFVLGILRRAGLTAEQIDKIERDNRRP